MPRVRQKNHNYKPLDGIGPSLASSQNVSFKFENLSNIVEFETEPGEVVDVILDESHSDYRAPEDIGKIRVRLTYSSMDVGLSKTDWKSTLPLVKPADPDIKVYPLKHEIVLCSYNLSNSPVGAIPGADANMIPQVMYYTRILNTANNVVQNAMMDVSVSYGVKSDSDYIPPAEDKLYGDTFVQNDIIRPIKHKEGDKVIEGRSGGSIRIGSEGGTGQNPSILIRNKQSTLISESNVVVDEDINEDGSSVWMTSNMVVPIDLGSTRWDQFTEFPELSGNQLTFNSDRIILNSKNDSILLAANNSILMSANNEVGINSDNFTVNSNNIFLGKYDNSQPMVLGTELISLLYELLGSLSTLTVVTAAGVSTPPVNSSNFIKLINKLNTIVSKKAFVE